MISFSGNNNEDGQYQKHECQSTRKGDWIIYTCSKCDFERKFNLVTGETRASGGSMDTFHRGNYFPAGIDPKLMNMN